MIERFFPRPAAMAALLAVSLALASPIALADYRGDIGFTKLQQDLGASIPTGAGVPVTQVEGVQKVNGQDLWMPDITNAEFVGKTIINSSNAGDGLYSGHATPVGQTFYGKITSISPTITNIEAFAASPWISTGFLKTVIGSGGAWPNLSTSRVANHSWVGSANPAPPDPNVDNYVLRRVDWLVETDEFIQVVGLSNGNGTSSAYEGLLASAYNVIAVGVSSGQHLVGSVAQDATYTVGRTRPDIVVPNVNTSLATPGVAAAAALLVETGRTNAGLSTDLVIVSESTRPRGLVRSAESSEVVKAALMAGADRITHNTDPTTNLTMYRGITADQTANGLDRRYGAGQLNIRNSYWIIAGGEQNSAEDGNAAPTVQARGFDYDPRFGGSNGSNTTATYRLPVSAEPQLLTASLVWNLDIAGGTVDNFSPTATLRNLNLAVIDLANANAVVISSASANENTENIWFVVPAGAQYALRVTRSGTFRWDYGLAWQLLPDADADGAHDGQDNCIDVANPGQVDSDNDGYGNICDADLNNNGTTNAQDYVLFRQQLGQPSTPPAYNSADLNGNGAVNAQDYVLFRQLLGSPPGPSGLVP